MTLDTSIQTNPGKPQQGTVRINAVSKTELEVIDSDGVRTPVGGSGGGGALPYKLYTFNITRLSPSVPSLITRYNDTGLPTIVHAAASVVSPGVFEIDFGSDIFYDGLYYGYIFLTPTINVNSLPIQPILTAMTTSAQKMQIHHWDADEGLMLEYALNTAVEIHCYPIGS